MTENDEKKLWLERYAKIEDHRLFCLSMMEKLRAEGDRSRKVISENHKLDDIIEDYNQSIDASTQCLEDITQALADIRDDNLRGILRDRYVLRMHWRSIAQKYHADESTVYRWHNRALSALRLPKDASK